MYVVCTVSVSNHLTNMAAAAAAAQTTSAAMEQYNQEQRMLFAKPEGSIVQTGDSFRSNADIQSSFANLILQHDGDDHLASYIESFKGYEDKGVDKRVRNYISVHLIVATFMATRIVFDNLKRAIIGEARRDDAEQNDATNTPHSGFEYDLKELLRKYNTQVVNNASKKATEIAHDILARSYKKIIHTDGKSAASQFPNLGDAKSAESDFVHVNLETARLLCGVMARIADDDDSRRLYSAIIIGGDAQAVQKNTAESEEEKVCRGIVKSTCSEFANCFWQMQLSSSKFDLDFGQCHEQLEDRVIKLTGPIRHCHHIQSAIAPGTKLRQKIVQSANAKNKKISDWVHVMPQHVMMPGLVGDNCRISTTICITEYEANAYLDQSVNNKPTPTGRK